MYGMYFSFVLFCIAIYCNLLWWRDYYYHFFTYIHVLFSINVFKRKKKPYTLLKPPLQNFAITHLILGLHHFAFVTFPIKLFYTVLRKKNLIRGQSLAVKGGIKI